ncbi:MAG: HAMP domain-containing histidine kinase [Gammaproteobacteria bacterium]|nr:HAMP domain-containing histidine kinase [Gammaproteobacteria bacterium]
MHRLLKRQLSRVFGKSYSADSLAPELQQFIETVSRTYDDYDRETSFIEESLNLYVEELVTAKKIAESSNAAKSEFLANMSHEMLTPLHAILNFAEFGKLKIDEASREKLSTYFINIHKSSDRLLVLVDDLLDMSKLEVGRMNFVMAQQDLLTIAKSVISDLSSLLEIKSLTTEFNIKTDNTYAYFDDVKIYQVIHNLLSNAIHSSPEKTGIEITLSDAKLPAKNMDETSDLTPALAFSVSDKGEGIPDDELDSIFEKFIQSSNTKTGAGGTGLGLAICDQIIRRHSGTIKAINNPEVGACLTFILHRELF